MKTLYLECNMGAAGDMLMAALAELYGDTAEFADLLNSIGIPKVNVSAQQSVKHGISCTKISVSVDGQHEHSHDENHPHSHDHEAHHSHDHLHEEYNHQHSQGGSYFDIEHIIGHLEISETVKDNALKVYKLIAEAESRAHRVSVDRIHFHEVGNMDAIADIVGVCMLIDKLAPDRILVSPVNVGSGHVRCSHGVLPVPTPATADLLKGIPTYSDGVKGELCTPTGAALLKHFADGFENMPLMNVCALGYGMGSKDFEKLNCVRAFLGESIDKSEKISELSCNLDDMTPETVAYAQKLLLKEGALDVYITPVVMKKNRAGIVLTCLCSGGTKEKMISLIFKHTTTLGIREHKSKRYVLRRDLSEIQTKFGPVGVKTASGFGVEKTKYEYEDISRIAGENDITLQEVIRACQEST